MILLVLWTKSTQIGCKISKSLLIMLFLLLIFCSRIDLFKVKRLDFYRKVIACKGLFCVLVLCAIAYKLIAFAMNIDNLDALIF